jgi:hypothetical protein
MVSFRVTKLGGSKHDFKNNKIKASKKIFQPVVYSPE